MFWYLYRRRINNDLELMLCDQTAWLLQDYALACFNIMEQETITSSEISLHLLGSPFCYSDEYFNCLVCLSLSTHLLFYGKTCWLKVVEFINDPLRISRQIISVGPLSLNNKKGLLTFSYNPEYSACLAVTIFIQKKNCLNIIVITDKFNDDMTD